MSRTALVRLWPFARPHAGRLALALLAGLGMTAAALSIPPITGTIVDELRAGRSSRIMPLAVAILLIGAIEALLTHLRRYGAAKASIAVEQDMRNALYRHLQRLHVAFHDGWQSGQLLSRAMGDLSTIRRFIGFGLMFLIINGVQFAVVAVLMVRLNAWLALATAVLAGPIVVLTKHFQDRYHDISRTVQDNQGDLATIVEESATGIRIVKAFGRGPHVSERFRAQADVVHDSGMAAIRLRAFFWSVLHLLPNLNLAVVLGGGGYAVVTGSMTLGELTTFITYLLMLNWPIRSIGWILANAEEAATAAERYFEVYDTVPEIRDREGAIELERVEGRIRLEGARLRFEGSEEEVLRGVDLEIAPGETLALVGPTGSGKSMVAALVPRLYDVTGGRVTLDGHDVRDVRLASLRRQIGVVFEEPILFSISVRENLMLGHPDATEDELRQALETANAEFAHDLPDGLETRIGEQGYSLSGGQRQRLALARAVIGRPRVLVLDDPLSAVDVHTEAHIERALERVLQGVTALVVVHRPSTLALADRVALLDQGRIVAVGTHAELLERVPLYRETLSQEAEVSR